MGLTIYLAGDMRSDWQDWFIKALDGYPIHWIDPRTHGLKDENEYTKWDIDGVKAADVVLAFLHAENPSGQGMSLEVGYAAAMGKHIVWVDNGSHPHARYFGMCRALASAKFLEGNEAIAYLKGLFAGRALWV